MTANPQTNQQGNQQKSQPDIRAQNPDPNRQFGQQVKSGANPQIKAGYDQPKQYARPDKEDEDADKEDSSAEDQDLETKSSDPYKKSTVEKY